MIIHEVVMVEVGKANRGEFHWSKFDKEMMPFLDDGGDVTKIAEEVVNLPSLYVTIIVEIEDGIGRLGFFFNFDGRRLGFLAVSRLGLQNLVDVTLDRFVKLGLDWTFLCC